MRHKPAPAIHPMACPCARCRAPALPGLQLRFRLILAAGAIGAGVLIPIIIH